MNELDKYSSKSKIKRTKLCLSHKKRTRITKITKYEIEIQCPQYVQMQSLHTYVVACFLITSHLKTDAY